MNLFYLFSLVAICLALVLAYLIHCKYDCCYFDFLTLFSLSKARKWVSFAPIVSFIVMSIVLNPDNAIAMNFLTLWSCTCWVELNLKSAKLSLICLSFFNEYKYRNWCCNHEIKVNLVFYPMSWIRTTHLIH